MPDDSEVLFIWDGSALLMQSSGGESFPAISSTPYVEHTTAEELAYLSARTEPFTIKDVSRSREHALIDARMAMQQIEARQMFYLMRVLGKPLMPWQEALWLAMRQRWVQEASPRTQPPERPVSLPA